MTQCSRDANSVSPVRPFWGSRRPAVTRSETAPAAAFAGAIDDLRGSAIDGAQPILRVAVRGAGGHLIALDRNASRIELAPDKFESYLGHEGLAAVLAERRRRFETGKPGRERYTRYLKALIQVGELHDATYGIAIGQQLELVPERDPVAVGPRGGAAGRRPVRGASYVSDAAGRVSVAIDRRGVWLVRMVHMIRCDGCDDADWASFWTSYAFATRDPSGRAVVAPAMFAAAAPRRWPYAAAAAVAAVALLALWLRRRK